MEILGGRLFVIRSRFLGRLRAMICPRQLSARITNRFAPGSVRHHPSTRRNANHFNFNILKRIDILSEPGRSRLEELYMGLYMGKPKRSSTATTETLLRCCPPGSLRGAALTAAPRSAGLPARMDQSGASDPFGRAAAEQRLNTVQIR